MASSLVSLQLTGPLHSDMHTFTSPRSVGSRGQDNFPPLEYVLRSPATDSCVSAASPSATAEQRLSLLRAAYDTKCADLLYVKRRARDEHAVLECERERLKLKSEARWAKCVELAHQVEAVHQRNAVLEGDKKRLQQQLTKALNCVNALKERAALHVESRSDDDDANEAHLEYSLEIARLTRKCESRWQQVTELCATVARLEAELRGQSGAARAEIEAELAEANSTIASLKEEVYTTAAALARAEAEAASLRGQLQEKGNGVDAASGVRSHSEVGRLQAAILAEQEKVSRLKDELAAAEEARDRHADELASMRSGRERQNSLLQAENVALMRDRKRLQHADATSEMHRLRYMALKRRLAGLGETVSDSSDEGDFRVGSPSDCTSGSPVLFNAAPTPRDRFRSSPERAHSPGVRTPKRRRESQPKPTTPVWTLAGVPVRERSASMPNAAAVAAARVAHESPAPRGAVSRGTPKKPPRGVPGVSAFTGVGGSSISHDIPRRAASSSNMSSLPARRASTQRTSPPPVAGDRSERSSTSPASPRAEREMVKTGRTRASFSAVVDPVDMAVAAVAAADTVRSPTRPQGTLNLVRGSPGGSVVHVPPGVAAGVDPPPPPPPSLGPSGDKMMRCYTTPARSPTSRGSPADPVSPTVSPPFTKKASMRDRSPASTGRSQATLFSKAPSPVSTIVDAPTIVTSRTRNQSPAKSPRSSVSAAAGVTNRRSSSTKAATTSHNAPTTTARIVTMRTGLAGVRIAGYKR